MVPLLPLIVIVLSVNGPLGCSTAPLEGRSPNNIAAVEALTPNIHGDIETHSVKHWSAEAPLKNVILSFPVIVGFIIYGRLYENGNEDIKRIC